MNIKKIMVIILIFLSQLIFPKIIIRNNNYQTKYSKLQDFTDKEKYEVITLDDLIAQGANIKIQKCFEDYFFEVAPFPLSSKFPNKGYFRQPFIIFIPQGKVQRSFGMVLCENKIIKDIFRGYESEKDSVKNNQSQIIISHHKIAVIAQFGSENYFHWTHEVLGRLALLEMYGIEYDKLYVSMSKPFMKEFLIDIWGIDPSKIIVARDTIDFIQADELIVPTPIHELIVLPKDQIFIGHLIHPMLTQYVREKVLFNLQKKINLDTHLFPKKIFISRHDAGRKILNENDIFKLFQEKGFKRYLLTGMSIVEQIALFYNADVIAGEHGANLTNILFCKPHTKIIELFQALVPIDYWWISRNCNLDYIAVNTINNNCDLFASTVASELVKKTIGSRMHVSLDNIKKIVETL